MSWRSIQFVIAGDAVEALCDALLALGALSVDVGDADAGTAAEHARFAEPGATAASWPQSHVRVLLDMATEWHSLLEAACATAGVAPPVAIDESVVQDADWVRLTQSQFKPIRITPRLWVVPTWEAVPDPAAINLILDPGAAFGTGSHPTTRLCLRWLADNVRGGECVVDYGCGSGILAIAAMRLGADRACGFDIDPQALLAARANAMQNRVAVDFHLPGDAPVPCADIVVANILANPLIALAPLLAAHARGHIVLAGVLESQADEVSHAYAAWFEMAPAAIDEGWALLVGRRREAQTP